MSFDLTDKNCLLYAIDGSYKRSFKVLGDNGEYLYVEELSDGHKEDSAQIIRSIISKQAISSNPSLSRFVVFEDFEASEAFEEGLN